MLNRADPVSTPAVRGDQLGGESHQISMNRSQPARQLVGHADAAFPPPAGILRRPVHRTRGINPKVGNVHTSHALMVHLFD